MQTNCPQCSQKLVVEDDKVPAGPFMLRCPKCQKTLKLPGKGGAALPPPGAEGAAQSAPPPAQPGSPAGNAAPSQPQPPKQPWTPSATSSAPPAPVAPAVRSGEPTDTGNGRALVALSDPSDQSLRDAVIALLEKNGYGIDTATDVQRGVQLLERNTYALVATSMNGGSGNGNVSLHKRVAALAPDIRRALFLVLLGTEFSSGDGTQAFAAMADLVLHPKDIADSEELLRSTVNERTRIFKPLQDAHARLDRRKY